MKISSIESQVKSKGRYSIFVDGKFSFGISELGLVDNKLAIGQELSQADVDELKDKAKLDRIYFQTLDLIIRRPRSRWEVEDYLRRKNLDPNTAEIIVTKLTEKNFIDDRIFAAKWIENRRLLKSISKRKLELELRQKHVSSEIIQSVMAGDETDDIDSIRQEIEKKRKQTRYQDDTKLMQYLSRQGYDYGDIKEALADQR